MGGQGGGRFEEPQPGSFGKTAVLEEKYHV